jgi:hypothetical protein
LAIVELIRPQIILNYGLDGVSSNSFFAGSSLVLIVDTPTTSVVLLIGDNLIRTAEGDLMTKDAIALRTNGAGESRRSIRSSEHLEHYQLQSGLCSKS